MFQRLKGAIDSRIAEEQARQRPTQSSLSRSSSDARRSLPRTASPATRAPRRIQERNDGGPPQRGPDPSDFDPEIVIDDESLPSYGESTASQTAGEKPAVMANGSDEAEDSKLLVQGRIQDDERPALPELPTDVRVKLRKLEKLESRYQELLRSYRIAHARVLSIEPFEISLRENTPLTSISDPAALVEYLNQLNLKGDMVLDELKRVSSERDKFKTKLEEAERSTEEAQDEVANLRVHKDTISTLGEAVTSADDVSSGSETVTTNVADESTSTTTMKSPTASIKARTSSIPTISLFSPKAKAVETPKVKEETEEFFSYDSEVPRLESELRNREEEVKVLQTEVNTLQGDLAIARESTQSMVQSLEHATRDVNTLRDDKERSKADLEEQRNASEKLQNKLEDDLETAREKLTKLETETAFQGSEALAELEGRLQGANDELRALHTVQNHGNSADEQIKELQSIIQDLQVEISRLQSVGTQSEKRINTLNGLVKNLRDQLTEAENRQRALKIEIEEKTRTTEYLQAQLSQPKELRKDPSDAMGIPRLSAEQNGFGAERSQVSEDGTTNASEGITTAKRRNKKKKRSGRATAVESKEPPTPDTSVQEIPAEGTRTPEQYSTLDQLQEELSHLHKLVEEKDTAIERLHNKLKDQEELREEIEGLRDDLIHVGQEHVDAKDKVKELLAEKQTLESTIASLEGELAEIRSTHTSQTARSDRALKDLAAQFEDLKLKATTLQTDLSAAQQLAASRFKDLSDLRNVLQKAQPELSALRSEVAELKVVREELSKKTTELIDVGARHEDTRSEITSLKRNVAERDTEARILNQKVGQETNSRLKAEDTSNRALDDLQRAESEKRQANQSLDRLSEDLCKSQEETRAAKIRLRELEQQIATLSREDEGLKEDIELKTAQHASAQSLMGSMRDQTSEMVMQMREARERCESLEEEVADANRLLSERSREGETMRRLLADVEGRADSRIREMKERMDTAIEERDRAEDEASAAGRRKARELEDLRNKIREAEKGMKRAEEDREELEISQRDWKRQREELEQRSGQSAREAEEVRKAMDELRDALDESESQARDLEKQKTDLGKTVENTQQRLEKFQKANKSMAEEVRSMQTAKVKAIDSEAQSSRSSLDSTPSRPRISSAVSKSRTGAAAFGDLSNGQAAVPIDYVYLKNVLLQFLEQRDKKHQMQLIPVLGMLLHFDRKDEQKWMAAITTK